MFANVIWRHDSGLGDSYFADHFEVGSSNPSPDLSKFSPLFFPFVRLSMQALLLRRQSHHPSQGEAENRGIARLVSYSRPCFESDHRRSFAGPASKNIEIVCDAHNSSRLPSLLGDRSLALMSMSACNLKISSCKPQPVHELQNDKASSIWCNWRISTLHICASYHPVTIAPIPEKFTFQAQFTAQA